ncbi:MAG: DMT family transporter [Chrysiogenetes bacterium]|nr:DMT family transporter [Chrysiogenetes bacterium]
MLVNIALLLAMSLAWAGNYLFISWADHGLPPVTASAAMTAAASLFLAAGVGLGLRRPLLAALRRRPLALVVMGATAVALPQLSVVAAEDAIPPELSSVIGTTVPILTFLVAAFLLHTRRARPLNLLGLAVAVGGIFLFCGGGALSRQPAELDAVAIMMAGGAVFVFNGLFAVRYTKDLDQEVVTLWVMVFATGGLALGALAVEGLPPAMPSAAGLAGIALAGIVGMGLAFLLYYRLIARAGAAFTSLYAFLVPPLGVLVAVLAGDREMLGRHLAGVAVVVVGLVLLLRSSAAIEPTVGTDR